MKTSQQGQDLIKGFEGCKLKAYVDPGTGGLPITIGYGNTARKDGSKFKLGDVITQERANELFLELLPKYEAIINKNIKVILNQNQYDALVSFCWNCGVSDALFRLINQKATDEVIHNWWINHYVSAGGKLLPGLLKRRRKEADLYIKK